MFILQLYSGQKTSLGDFVYRIERPAKGLSSLKEIEVLNLDLLAITKPDLLLEVPLLILHHLSDPDLLPLIAERKARGKSTIYEIADNFRASHLHRQEARRTGAPDYHLVMQEIIRRCDAVQTTGRALEDRYRELNPNFFRFPNLVDERDLRPQKGKSSEWLTVGWGGSTRHAEDIKSIAAALVKWIMADDKVRFAIMASKSIQLLFRDLPPKKLVTRSPGSLQDYLAFLDGIDIGIAPLSPNEFNACRSDVKFLEYASRGVAPICSRYGPYLDVAEEGKSILLFETSDELISHLEKLRTNRELGLNLAQYAQEWVKTNRLTNPQIWDRRAAQYRSLSSQSSSFAIADFRGSYQSGVARHINEALDIEDERRAFKRFAEVSRRFPGNYHTHYFCGWALSNLGQHREAIAPLEKALSVRPNSIRTAQLMTRLLLISGQPLKALETIEKALLVEPELPTLIYLKATTLLVQGQNEKAWACLSDCLDQAPDYVEALLTLGQTSVALRKWKTVESCVCKLQHLVPDSPEVPWLRANISFHKQATQAALMHLESALKKDPLHRKSKNLLARIDGTARPKSSLNP